MTASLFTRSAFRSLQHLRELNVSNCSLLKEIDEEEEVDARGDGSNEKTPISLLHLKSVNLSDLLTIQNIGISACYMPTLVTVNVLECRLITSLFIDSAFRNLQHLQTLNVFDCRLLEEIVEEEEEEDARHGGTNEKTPISLLHLKSVFLSNLPNLQNIGISACYMPALVTVIVLECRLITFLFTRPAFRNLQHQTLNVFNCRLLEVKEDARDDGTNKKTLISLLHKKIVFLSNLPNLLNIGICGRYMPTLVKVDVNGCELITSLYTRPAFGNLQHLEELKVSDCSLLEEIVEDELNDVTPGMSEKMISIPLLTNIRLENLPRLRSFSSSTTFTFDIPALGDLSQFNCPITASSVLIFSNINREMIDES